MFKYPVVVGTPRVRIRGRKLFAFSVDDSDIKKEFGKLIAAMAQSVPYSIKKTRADRKIIAHARGTLFQEVPRKSPKIKRLDWAMSRYKFIGVEYSKRKRVGLKRLPITKMGLYNIDELDRLTNIDSLERKFPSYHYAPFQSPSLVKKKTGQRSKKFKKNTLWRILQYGKKVRYKIPVFASGPLSYTTERDNYSRWHVRRSVTWFTTKPSARGIYYLMAINNEMYKSDRKEFYNAIVKGVETVLLRRTRFHL